MATVTPNYSWPVPTSGDLVKDGATAIEALGDAIDATVFGLPASGLAKISTTSFTTVTSQSVNNVFTSAYRNYRIFITLKASADIDTFWRLRGAGTDLTSNNYYEGRYYVGNTASLGAGSQNNTLGTKWTLNSISTMQGMIVIDVSNPQTAEVTHAFVNTSARYFQALAQGLNNITTSYDGFTIFTDSATTITGRVTVYGYNE
jgi:hypothetical protein